MRAGGVNLGRIWAVPIRGAYSLLALLLVLAGIAAWQFSAIAPGHSVLGYALAALFSAVLFVWTVFAHEVAHIVAAREYGARVNGVTLSFLGGVTAISGQPATPRQGAVVALAGPMVSIVSGVALGALAFGTLYLHLGVLVALALFWTGGVSILLGLANLVPAAPLDGGHILQAAVWWGTRNRLRGSAVAGFLGEAVGVAIVGWALWLAVFGSPIAAGSAAIMAWPIWRGASATHRAAQQRAHLGGLTVSDLMRPEPELLPDDIAVSEAAAQLGRNDVGYVAVVDEGGRPRGVASVRRIRQAAVTNPRRTLGRLIRHRSLVTAAPDEPLADVLERSNATPKAVLVLAGDQPTGLLDPGDVRAALEAQHDPSAPSAEPTDVWPGPRAAGDQRSAA